MEAAAGRSLLSLPPLFPAKNPLTSSSSVLMFHEQAAPALNRPIHNNRMFKDGKSTIQATLDGRLMETRASAHEEKITGDSDELVRDFERQLLHWPSLWSLLAPSPTGKYPSSSLTKLLFTAETNKLEDAKTDIAVFLAKEAVSASKEAALFAGNFIHLDNSLSTCLSTCLPDTPPDEVKIVRSTRHSERQNKNRRSSRSTDIADETYNPRKIEAKKKIKSGLSNDPLRLFLWGPETRQLLTLKEESKLVSKVQDLLILERMKSRLQDQFGREPTMVEWAEAVGLSCIDLRSQLSSGNRSRDKLVYANLRLVVHVAKQFQGRGIGFQDLLQEGSVGLMKSVGKFKPQGGCRFPSYAYWWIRQTIRKAIFQHSRTIRLPENVYTLLCKVREAKGSYIQEGNHCPSSEEIAERAGITVDKLKRLLSSTQQPTSMQQPIWTDQKTTVQEVTADMGVERPEVSVEKQLMRQHVRHLLIVLDSRERKIIRLRFGIEDGNAKSLSQIGLVFGLCKERVRQLESRALTKLKEHLNGEGLEAYVDLLVNS